MYLHFYFMNAYTLYWEEIYQTTNIYRDKADWNNVIYLKLINQFRFNN